MDYIEIDRLLALLVQLEDNIAYIPEAREGLHYYCLNEMFEILEDERLKAMRDTNINAKNRICEQED